MKLSFHKLEDLQTGRPRWAPVFPACNNHAARIHVVLLTARGIRSSQHLQVMVAPNCHKISPFFSGSGWQNCLAAWPSKSNHFHQFPGNDLAGSAGI